MLVLFLIIYPHRGSTVYATINVIDESELSLVLASGF